jgi:glucose dehydrogenase
VVAQETARVVTANELLNAGGDGTEWLTYGHDYAETHFSPLNQINKKNVKRLSLAWSSTTETPQGTGSDTILTSAVRVVKGKVIVGSSGAEQAVRGYFSAYDAETGKRAWRFYTVPGDPKKPFERCAV